MSEQVSREVSSAGEAAISQSAKPFPERLFEAGFRDVVSVIPPGAQLAPTSKISRASVGKAPGRRNAHGLWGGYDWRKHEPTIDDVRRWVFQGANVGLRAAKFPGVDIDCTDPALAQLIEDAVRGCLGPAPSRVGRAPKRLMMYRTDEPFSRMRLNIKTPEGGSHLVEILGDGQQYLVHGTHPSGKAYQWLQDPTTTPLTTITREQASQCLDTIQQVIETLGAGVVEREGDGRRQQRAVIKDQDSLLAPNIEALRECVSLIPNSDALFPDREDYIKIGYAIKAAAGTENEEDGYEIFADWASRWDGGDNAPDVVRDDWRRMNGAKAVGWRYLAELARPQGFNDAAYEFDVVEARPAPGDGEIELPEFSDQWLTKRISKKEADSIRYVPERDQFLIWDSTRWQPDTVLETERRIKEELGRVGARVARMGGTAKEIIMFQALARSICSGARNNAVRGLFKSEARIAVGLSKLDEDPWILNTPGGTIDLRTGTVRPCDPRDLCSRLTAAAPDFEPGCPTWERFLDETTACDVELQKYLQRLAGYCLTGSTREQQLSFVWGPGGNGKGVFVNTLTGILGEYARTAPMDTFTASPGERHPTDLAMLAGARLVAASETSANKSWDDARIKSLTGGDPITARFMRQDFFTYYPAFKLILVGNHKPALRTVEDAIKRRMHIVPFTNKPIAVDPDLPEKLKAEWPGILAWMIKGCLEWQREGLRAPEAITAATNEYLAEQDLLGRWLEQSCELDAGRSTSLQDLFESFGEWANANGETRGTTRAFSQLLRNHGFERGKDPRTRRTLFHGLTIRAVTELTDLPI
jgi:putative DNA primase/helicase